jgi:hypothetical protein
LDDVVIISGCRTAVGKFQGSLSELTAPQLGAIVVREAVKRAGIEPQQVDECIMGNVVSAGLGQNPARQAAIYGGLSPEVGAMTINKVCGSGLKAVALAAQAIQTGNSSIVVAGGMESMTNAPYLLPQARKGYRLGNSTIVDSMVHDGLWDIYNDYHMGITGENVRCELASQGSLGDQGMPVQIADRSRGIASEEEGRPSCHLRQGREPARGHYDRSAACAQAGFQERWDSDCRQRPGRE